MTSWRDRGRAKRREERNEARGVAGGSQPILRCHWSAPFPLFLHRCHRFSSLFYTFEAHIHTPHVHARVSVHTGGWQRVFTTCTLGHGSLHTVRHSRPPWREGRSAESEATRGCVSTERGSRLANAESVATSVLSCATAAAALSPCFSLADWFLDGVGCCHQLLQVDPLRGLQKLLQLWLLNPAQKCWSLTAAGGFFQKPSLLLWWLQLLVYNVMVL